MSIISSINIQFNINLSGFLAYLKAFWTLPVHLSLYWQLFKIWTFGQKNDHCHHQQQVATSLSSLSPSLSLSSSSPSAAESHGLAAVPGGHELAPAGLGLAAQPPPVDAGGDHRVPEPAVIVIVR